MNGRPLSRTICSFLVIISFILLPVALAFGELRTFEKEYTYQASEDDSKNSSRTIALREVKRLLLEELGTYLESETEVKNFQLTQDQITTLTAGIVKADIADEKWDGKMYWLKARISADPESVVQSIASLRKDREKTRELEEIRRKADELLKENANLREQLKSAKGERREQKQREYRDNIISLTAVDWYEKGISNWISSGLSGNYIEAIEAYSKAIELNPKYVAAYYQRGSAYSLSRNDKQAIEDYSKAIELDPKYADAYSALGKAYSSSGNYHKAIAYINKAIGLDPRNARYYSDRGHIYFMSGDYQKAIADYSKAIELDPKDDFAYQLRVTAYLKFGNYQKAIADLNKPIELDPTNARAYNRRGSHYVDLGNYQQAVVSIPGIEEIEEIAQILKGPRTMTPAEQVEMERIRQELGKTFCHRCDYCQPCTEEIPISTVMTSRSFAKRLPPQRFFSGFTAEALGKAANCSKCGSCEERCPYHLPIMDMMEELSAWYQEEKKKYEALLTSNTRKRNA